jgi:hypothetical protein
VLLFLYRETAWNIGLYVCKWFDWWVIAFIHCTPPSSPICYMLWIYFKRTGGDKFYTGLAFERIRIVFELWILFRNSNSFLMWLASRAQFPETFSFSKAALIIIHHNNSPHFWRSPTSDYALSVPTPLQICGTAGLLLWLLARGILALLNSFAVPNHHAPPRSFLSVIIHYIFIITWLHIPIMSPTIMIQLLAQCLLQQSVLSSVKGTRKTRVTRERHTSMHTYMFL